jgi:fructose-bisphosphate aldolase class II
MSLYNLKRMLSDARRKKYGVLASPVFNFDSAEALLAAAEERDSPVILMISDPMQKRFGYFNFKRLIGPLKDMAKESPVPVVLHLDHGSGFENIMRYIEAGLTSVMISGETDLEKNMENTRKIVQAAHKYGVTVEGEVGLIEGEGGLEGDARQASSKEDIEKSYTKPAEAKTFVENTGVDALAVSVGTSHGYFKSTPSIDLELISGLSRIPDVSLVVHGASGLEISDYREMVKRGIVKFNYYTGLIHAATEEARSYLCSNGEVSFTECNFLSLEALKEKAKWLMDIFGSSGKATRS